MIEYKTCIDSVQLLLELIKLKGMQGMQIESEASFKFRMDIPHSLTITLKGFDFLSFALY